MDCPAGQRYVPGHIRSLESSVQQLQDQIHTLKQELATERQRDLLVVPCGAEGNFPGFKVIRQFLIQYTGIYLDVETNNSVGLAKTRPTLENSQYSSKTGTARNDYSIASLATSKIVKPTFKSTGQIKKYEDISASSIWRLGFDDASNQRSFLEIDPAQKFKPPSDQDGQHLVDVYF